MTGQTVSHYRILEKLGAGGMGVVYKAEDTRLGRRVAIKFLHRAAESELDFARFQREARAASILNHPNICTVYDIGEHNGDPFLVMECLEGKTLADEIAQKRLPIETAVDLAWQCADALEAAHAHKLMHRDLKPANIFVVARGHDLTAKILDFGLAKTAEPSERELEGQTNTMDSLTTPGSTVGTVAYMSPEQARGEKLDTRTDIFSLGSVMYEMIAGVRPFTGASQAVLFDGILNRTPEAPSRIHPAVPKALDAIILKALQKKPAGRYQSAADLRTDLSHLRQATGSRTGSGRIAGMPERSGIPLWAKYGAAIAALAVVGVGGYAIYKRPGPPLSDGVAITQITDSGHVSIQAYDGIAISPDSKYLAYVEQRGDDERVFTRQLAGGSAIQVLGPEKLAMWVAFAPDGNSIYVTKAESLQGVLYRIPVLGGAAKKILSDLYGAVAFSPDGRKLAFGRAARGSQPNQSTGSVVVANVDGSAEKTIATDKSVLFAKVRWSPDGKTIAAITRRFSLLLIPAAGGAPLEFKVPGWRQIESVEWLRSGRGFLVTAEEQSAGFSAHHQVLEVSYPDAKVTRVTNDLSDHHSLSVSADGSSLAVVDLVNRSNIWIAPAGEPDKAVKIEGGRSQGFRGVAWTKDGRLVFGDEASTGYVMNADGSALRLFAPDQPTVRLPRLCGPGPLLAFVSGATTASELSVGDPDSGVVRKVAESITGFATCTPDGSFLISAKSDGIWKTPIAPPESKRDAKEKEGAAAVRLFDNGHQALVSPDGKWIAMHQLSPGPPPREKMAIKSMTGGADAKFPDALLGQFGWLPDSSGLVYQKLDGEVGNLWTRPLTGGPEKQLTHSTSDYIVDFAYSALGKLAIARGTQTRDVVLIQRK